MSLYRALFSDCRQFVVVERPKWRKNSIKHFCPGETELVYICRGLHFILVAKTSIYLCQKSNEVGRLFLRE